MEAQEKESAEEHLKMQLAMHRDMGVKDPNSLNAMVARNILHEELGRFRERQRNYSLDAETSNRLLVHTRQDAAHAVLNTSSVLDQIRTLKRLVIVLSFLMAFGAICMVAVLLR
jgi:hypothetical protein